MLSAVIVLSLRLLRTRHSSLSTHMLHSKKMWFLYSFLYTCSFFLALPYFVIVGLMRGKYLSTFYERMGNIACRSERPSVWIHTVSVGEFLACKALIKRIQQEIPD